MLNKSLKNFFLSVFFFTLYINSLFAAKVVDEYNLKSNFFCQNGNCKQNKFCDKPGINCNTGDTKYIKSTVIRKRTHVIQDNINSDSELRDKKFKIIGIASLPSVNTQTTLKKKEDDTLDRIRNHILYEANLSGIYVTAGASLNTEYKISGTRYVSGYDENAKIYPENSSNSSFYIGFGGNLALPYYLFLGAEAFYTEPKTSTTAKWNVSSMIINNVITASQVDLNSVTTLNRAFGVKLKAGFHVWRMALYGIIGYQYNMLTHNTYSVNSSFSENHTNGVHNIIYGFGAEFYITNAFFIKVEYIINNFSYKTTFNGIYQVNNNAATEKLSFTDKMNLSTVLIGVGFKFTM